MVNFQRIEQSNGKAFRSIFSFLETDGFIYRKNVFLMMQNDILFAINIDLIPHERKAIRFDCLPLPMVVCFELPSYPIINCQFDIEGLMKKDHSIAHEYFYDYNISIMKEYFVSNIYPCFHLVKDFSDALTYRETMQRTRFGHRLNATKGMILSWLKVGNTKKAVEECDYCISFIENDLHNNPFSLQSGKMEKYLLEVKEIKRNITIEPSYYMNIIDSIICEKKALINNLFRLKE